MCGSSWLLVSNIGFIFAFCELLIVPDDKREVTMPELIIAAGVPICSVWYHYLEIKTRFYWGGGFSQSLVREKYIIGRCDVVIASTFVCYLIYAAWIEHLTVSYLYGLSVLVPWIGSYMTTSWNTYVFLHGLWHASAGVLECLFIYELYYV